MKQPLLEDYVKLNMTYYEEFQFITSAHFVKTRSIFYSKAVKAEEKKDGVNTFLK